MSARADVRALFGRVDHEFRARGRGILVAAALGTVLLGACKHKPVVEQGPASDAAAPVASETVEASAPVAVAAANEADVTRYPDELPLDHVLGTTRAFASVVRTQASATAGIAVDTLKAETDVDEVADRDGFMLVYFIDPKDPSRKLLGWVSKVDFATPPAVAPTHHGALACAPPQMAVQHAAGETCEHTCVSDRLCPPGQTCSGTGALVLLGGLGPPVRFCRASALEPPPTVPPPLAPTLPPRTLDVRQEHGACPGGYARCGAMCRLQCASVADCGGPPAHCLQGFCLAAGSVPCAH